MQMHYAPLQIAATIVFIPDDKRLSGDNTIVNPIFSAAKRGLTNHPSGENCEALLDSAKIRYTNQPASLLHMSVSDSDPRQHIVWPLKKDAPS